MLRRGFKHSPETKKKMSLKNTASKITPENN